MSPSTTRSRGLARRGTVRRVGALATTVVFSGLAASGGLLAVGATAASADAPGTISSSGPLTSIAISPTLNCAVNYLGDSAGEWYQDIACGTLVATDDGKLYGPSSIPAGSGATSSSGYQAYTPVSQTSPTGAGTASSPYVVTTVVDLGDSGLQLTETDSYVVGRQSYRTDVKLTSDGSTGTRNTVVYRAGDCYLQDSDYGPGAVLNGTSPICKAQATSANPDRLVGFFPLTKNSHYMEANYNEIWSAVGSRTQLPDTTRGAEVIDNAVAISWAAKLAGAGSSATLSSLTSFSPEGTTPVTLEEQADQSTSEPGAGNGYTVKVTNAGATAQTLSSISATLPAGFSYTPGSSTGLTTADPTVSGQRLTWNGSFVIPAGTAEAPGTATLHFGVSVSSTPGRYTSSVTAEGEGVTVLSATNTAPIQVVVGGNRQPVVTLTQPAATPEGTARALKATAKDADGDALTYAWTATPGAGVDEGAECSFSDPTVLKAKVTCDDDGTWTLTLTVDDNRSGTVQKSTTLEVTNAAPKLNAAIETPKSERLSNRPITVSGTLSDAGGNDTHTYSISWGDGSEPTTGSAGGGSFQGTHTYAFAGTYSVVVTVSDDDGASVQKTLSLKLKEGGVIG